MEYGHHVIETAAASLRLLSTSLPTWKIISDIKPTHCIGTFCIGHYGTCHFGDYVPLTVKLMMKC